MAILSIGFACFDQFFFLNEWPQENTKNFCHDFIESGGGPAANAAPAAGIMGRGGLLHWSSAAGPLRSAHYR